MMHLVNGRGQLGDELKKYSDDQTIDRVYVYHTWNVQSKTEDEQNQEYKKFQKFVDAHAKEKIILVSTKSQRETWYTHYKQLAEGYLLTHCKTPLIIRFPTFIGKGIIEKFKNDIASPYGEMELISIKAAAKAVVNACKYDNGLLKCIVVDGDKIPAQLVYDLVKRG